jgi:hypothetical protein
VYFLKIGKSIWQNTIQHSIVSGNFELTDNWLAKKDEQ